MTDLAAIVILLFFTVRGWQKGLIAAVTSVMGPLLGYAAVLLFARPLGGWIAAQQFMKPAFAYPVASIALFFAVQTTISSLSYTGHDWLEKRAEINQGRITRLYWAAGAAVGAVTGTAVAVLVVWAMTFYTAVRAELKREAPPAARTFSQEAAGKILSAAAAWAFDAKKAEDGKLARTVEAVVRDPINGLRALRAKPGESGAAEDEGPSGDLGKIIEVNSGNFPEGAQAAAEAAAQPKGPDIGSADIQQQLKNHQ